MLRFLFCYKAATVSVLLQGCCDLFYVTRLVICSCYIADLLQVEGELNEIKFYPKEQSHVVLAGKIETYVDHVNIKMKHTEKWLKEMKTKYSYHQKRLGFHLTKLDQQA
ncbi:hypothetical protein QVD17_12196 [Tagetes erecta]|uniref:Uncharacterized protein n=1 Tax=Tagetes erecta TaxID=13708 RepID=A0AAD8KUM5_TARER|nr:hypothetical protein QVD17_12196 [Tagetes erecta]